MADQPRRHGVEHPSEKEPTGARHRDLRFLKVIGAPRRQCLELRPLNLQCLAATRIGAADDLVDEAAVGIEIDKISAATQQQGLLQSTLEVGVRAFDSTVLVRDTRVVARRRHAVVRTQRLVALGQIFRGITLQIAECRREVSSVLQFSPKVGFENSLIGVPFGSFRWG